MSSFLETRANLGELIEGVGVKFQKVFNETDEAYVSPLGEMLVTAGVKSSSIFKEESITGSIVHYTGKTGVNLTQLTGEGDDMKIDQRFFGYRTDVAPQKFSNGIAVTMEARDDLDRQYKSEMDEFKDLVTAAHQREAKSSFDLLNYGFTAQASLPGEIYPYGDGKPLFSTAHPRLDGGTAQANTFSSVVTQLPLSDTALELGRINLLSQLSNRGLPLASTNQVALLLPSALEKTGMILANSIKRPGTANNDVNIYDGMLTVMASKWFNAQSTTAWYLVDAGVSQLRFLRRAPVSTYSVMQANLTQIFYVWHRYAVAWTQWVGTFGSKGDSSAYSG